MPDRTAAAQWRVNGEPDPHGRHYDGERAALAMGHMTDDEFANELYLNGDVQPSVQQLIDGTAFRPIVWLTAAKERIRWLSRALERELAHNAGAIEAMQEILRVHANDNQRPRAFYIAADALAKLHGTAGTATPEQASAVASSEAAAQVEAAPNAGDFSAVFDALGVGSAARTPSNLLTNVQNLIRRSQCLSALENTFFTVQTPPEDGEVEPGEDCLLNWGDAPENYVKDFRKALGTLFGALPSFGWTRTTERRPDAGTLIVKRWASGSVWAGVYSGSEKDSSFDEWCELPREFAALTDLGTEFKEAKAVIMSLPDGDVRGLAIAQFIQLQLHQKYPSRIVPGDVRASFDAMADAFMPTFGTKGSAQRERMWQAMVDGAFGVAPEDLHDRLAPLLNEFGMRQWQSGRGVAHESIEDAFDAVIAAACGSRKEAQRG